MEDPYAAILQSLAVRMTDCMPSGSDTESSQMSDLSEDMFAIAKQAFMDRRGLEYGVGYRQQYYSVARGRHEYRTLYFLPSISEFNPIFINNASIHELYSVAVRDASAHRPRVEGYSTERDYFEVKDARAHTHVFTFGQAVEFINQNRGMITQIKKIRFE
jgi:hypothetical protein